MFDNSLDNDTYADNFISNNVNFIDSNSDIITPNSLELNSISNAIDGLLIAQDLGTLSEREQFQGNVSPIDREDLYRFTTDKIGDLDYRLTGLSNNANIQLLDSDGNMLSGSFKSGTASEYKVPTRNSQQRGSTRFISLHHGQNRRSRLSTNRLKQ